MKHAFKHTRTLSPWLLAVAFLAVCGPVQAETRAYRLDNGLRVIVKEDRRAPVVVSQIWYRAGSMDEVTGATGVAHVLEHMMFKGTRAVPAGGFSKRIAAAGGRDNAFTARDYTVYFEQLEKSQLPLALRLEADRMHNLALSSQAFSKEIKVVREERRWRTDDKPQSLVYEQLMAAAYTVFPYHHPVIGWMEDLQNMTVADARRWYRQWYAPNNATLVVVGDVTPDAVFRLAKRDFGPIPARLLPPRKTMSEPPQRGVKRVNVKASAKLPYLIMGYHVPVLRRVEKDWAPYALEILAGVLDGNPAARLNQRLVREQRVATEVGAGYDPISRGPGMFLLEGTPAKGNTLASLEAALRAEVENIQRDGVTPAELNRVKAQVIASRVYQRDSLFYQAMRIGRMESVGLSYRDLGRYLDKLQAVTARQVRDVARKYFRDDNLTVATLDPQPLKQRQPLPRWESIHAK